MKTVFLLLAFLCTLAYADYDDNSDCEPQECSEYCDAYCECTSCDQCKKAGYYPACSEEQCKQFCETPRPQGCSNNNCSCSQELNCGPKNPKPCDDYCSAYCKCSKCNQCKDTGYFPAYPESECNKSCETQRPAGCRDNCSCTQEINCGPKNPKPCNDYCSAYCKCSKCNQCKDTGYYPAYPESECIKSCQAHRPVACQDNCSCTQEINCGPKNPKPCDDYCSAYCKCSKCNQCKNTGYYPAYPQSECDKSCQAHRPAGCQDNCSCTQEINCGPKNPKPCDDYCSAYCKCSKCNQCKDTGYYPAYPESECIKSCQAHRPAGCQDNCSCTQEINCGPKNPKPCNDYCSAYCKCSKCNQCKNTGYYPAYTESECDESCRAHKPAGCHDNCSCTQEINCGPKNPKPCDDYCSAYCKCSKCNQCKNTGYYPAYPESECNKSCEAHRPAGCHDSCSCTQEINCGPKNPKACNDYCSAYCKCSKCKQCKSAGYYPAYPESECYKSCQARRPAYCKDGCGCTKEFKCGPRNPKVCNEYCSAYCKCSKCNQCKHAGYYPAYPESECYKSCQTRKPAGCKDGCGCTKEFRCGPRNPKVCNAYCSAYCKCSKCKSCEKAGYYPAYPESECTKSCKARKPAGCKDNCACTLEFKCGPKKPNNCAKYCNASCICDKCKQCEASGYQPFYSPYQCNSSCYIKAHRPPGCPKGCPCTKEFKCGPKKPDECAKYCNATCICQGCKDCEASGYEPFYSPYQCNSSCYIKAHRPPGCEDCFCTEQFKCGPKKPENCSDYCNASCVCKKCKQCDAAGYYPYYTSNECNSSCYKQSHAPPNCGQCFCTDEFLCGPEKPKNCDDYCNASCICDKCTQCEASGYEPFYSPYQCNSSCYIKAHRPPDCTKGCPCTKEFKCGPKKPDECAKYCNATCVCQSCKNCEASGYEPFYTQDECSSACYAKAHRPAGCEDCFCSQLFKCGPQKPENCSDYCNASCVCKKCEQCDAAGYYPYYTSNECNSSCYKQSHAPPNCGQCFCTDEFLCGPEKPKNCDDYCNASCICRKCKQCEASGYYPFYTSEQCNSSCYIDAHRPSGCGDCYCTQEFKCGPQKPQNCSAYCDAYCKCTKCDQCKKQGYSPAYPEYECEKYCEACPPEGCEDDCVCTLEFNCGPKNPQPCEQYCGAYCNCTRCEQCKAAGKPPPYSQSECDAYCKTPKPYECKDNCSCSEQLTCGPEKNLTCCGAICACSYCTECPTQTLYTDSQCKESCEKAKTPECSVGECHCSEEPECPEECNCSAVCTSIYCACPSQTKYSSWECEMARREANSSDCYNKRCGCPAIPECPPPCNCSAYCNGPFCTRCKTQTLYPKETCDYCIREYNSPQCQKHDCVCPLDFPYCPNPDTCNCSAAQTCTYCKNCASRAMYSDDDCKKACDQAEEYSQRADCQAAKCNYNDTPNCTCNCIAKCFYNYCTTCKTNYLYPCANYIKQAESPECQKAVCNKLACPRFELYCPQPGSCDCKKVQICAYCKNDTNQCDYTEDQCKDACKVAETPDCKARKDCLPNPEPCKQYCQAYCNCTQCRQCEAAGKPPPYSKSECDAYCQTPKPKDCKDNCSCIEQFTCGPGNASTCCPAVCTYSYCVDCPNQRNYTSTECQKARDKANSTECSYVRCGCPLQQCPKECNCSAVCTSSYCEQCPGQTWYSSEECQKAKDQCSAAECYNKTCSCPAQPACPPGKCDCGAYCKCRQCQQCENAGKPPPYSQSECDAYCKTAQPKDCQKNCSCIQQFTCGPEKNFTCCEASCTSSFCINCPNQRNYSSSECKIARDKANTAECKPQRCFCPLQKCPKECNCSAVCTSSYCKECPGQTWYSTPECQSAQDQCSAPECYNKTCSCPAQPSCPPGKCNCESYCKCRQCQQCENAGKPPPYSKSECDAYCKCPQPKDCKNNCSCIEQFTCGPQKNYTCCEAICNNAYCKQCPNQRNYTSSECQQAQDKANSYECSYVRCSCLERECPKECNCSAICTWGYCNSCSTQNLYTYSQCQEAYKQATAPGCDKERCPCPSYPTCPPPPPNKCNCSAYCNGPYCTRCKTQTLYPKETCDYCIREYNSPQCQKSHCICPLAVPYCPNPDTCNCTAAQMCTYCNNCASRAIYTDNDCKQACAQANGYSQKADCQAAKCNYNNTPKCTCNCLAKCFYDFCKKCPTNYLYPCDSYIKQAESPECQKAVCNPLTCPRYELYCPQPGRCDCKKVQICAYCQNDTNQCDYTEDQCKDACKVAETPDCKARKDCFSNPEPCKGYCQAYCNCRQCQQCKNAGKPPPYSQSECDAYCQTPKPKDCKDNCTCTEQFTCGPGNISTCCSAICNNAYCKQCPNQRKNTYSECQQASDKANSYECSCVRCSCLEQECPKECNCSAVCISSYCKECPGQTWYSTQECQTADNQCIGPECYNKTCSCPAQPSCPPGNCNCGAYCKCRQCQQCENAGKPPPYSKSECDAYCKCPQAKDCQKNCSCIEQFTCGPEKNYTCCGAICTNAYCKQCPNQRNYTSSECQQAQDKANSYECSKVRCGCVAQECPKECNCSAICTSIYCACPSQTRYSSWECEMARRQANSSDCYNKRCGCPEIPACPPPCNCSAYCNGPYCTRCKTQTFYPKETCDYSIREYNSPQCQKHDCICPLALPYCPNPDTCNCTAAQMCTYCNNCASRAIYTDDDCKQACAQADGYSQKADCQAAKCNYNDTPKCTCNCLAKCFYDFCKKCPTNYLYPCDSYIKQAESPECQKAVCNPLTCPRYELYCPQPGRCDCKKVQICAYCKNDTNQCDYTEDQCKDACKVAETPDCKARKDCLPNPEPCKQYCQAYCNCSQCRQCEAAGKSAPYSKSDCDAYCQTPKPKDCKDNCTCTEQFTCGPGNISTCCSAICNSAYCKQCPNQRKYTYSECQQASDKANSYECSYVRCSCLEQECPKECNCSAVCISSYCKECPGQTWYSTQECQTAQDQCSAPECYNKTCSCPAQPSCPPGKCNCGAYCKCRQCQQCENAGKPPPYSKSECDAYCKCPQPKDCQKNCYCTEQFTCGPEKNYTCCGAICTNAYCKQCPNQRNYTSSECQQAQDKANSYECSKIRCKCVAPECPKECNCSASCISSYCKACPGQTWYSAEQCQTAKGQASAPECYNRTCNCPAQPACPVKCNCSAYCSAPYCKSCKTQTTFSKDTCDYYVREYDSPRCQNKSGCFCPLFLRYCPNPGNCNCTAARMCTYCKNCSSRAIYSDNDCKQACSQAEDFTQVVDCQAAKCNYNDTPKCTCNCLAKCFYDFCKKCPTNYLYPCDSYIKQAESPECRRAVCNPLTCPRYELYCPQPGRCDCKKVQICAYCKNNTNQCDYTEDQCKDACQVAETPDCKARKDCLQNPEPCKQYCQAYCNCTQCRQCEAAGKPPPYSKSDCDAYCNTPKPKDCKDNCTCTEQFTCGPGNISTCCSAICTNAYCKKCPNQRNYTSSECKQASDKANSYECSFVRCSCLEQECPKECNCSAYCKGQYCKSCKTQTTFSKGTCNYCIKEYNSPSCQHNPGCSCPHRYCPNPKNCDCKKVRACRYCKSHKKQRRYSRAKCKRYCKYAKSPDCRAAHCPDNTNPSSCS